jgi:hypothetical protein
MFRYLIKQNETNSVAFSPQPNYTDRESLVGEVSAKIAVRGVSRGLRKGSPWPLISSF